MKKVLAIAPYPYLPYFSGGQKFIARFFHYLGKETDLTVITVGENDFSLAATYKTIPLLKGSFSRYFDLGLVKKITAEVKKNKYDTLIWEHPYYAWLAFLVRKKTGIKTIIHTHNIEYQRFRSMGKWWWPVLMRYEKWSFRKADNIFFITPEDKAFAVNRWNILPAKCIDLPFGVEIKASPPGKAACRNKLGQLHHIGQSDKILLFNGLLNYKPNLDALKVILEEINPILSRQKDFNYKIIVCGKNLPAELNDLKDYQAKNIIYAGFVDDIETYFLGADLFLNPVQSGGGIKTKMVEAIAFGTTVIATETGAAGILEAVCGNKLVIVPDNEWSNFTLAVLNNTSAAAETPAAYYAWYYWENVIGNMLKALTHPASA